MKKLLFLSLLLIGCAPNYPPQKFHYKDKVTFINFSEFKYKAYIGCSGIITDAYLETFINSHWVYRVEQLNCIRLPRFEGFWVSDDNIILTKVDE